nr:divergent polysaccharide deacetylase family protein [Rhodobacter sp. SGA-6-6]
MGAGLGALVGTGLLAIVSVMAPGPKPAPAGPAEPAAAENPAPETAPAEPEVAESPVPEEAPAEPVAEAPAAEAAAPAVADAPEAPPVAAAEESGPDTPSDAAGPAVAEAPSAPAELTDDPAPGPAETPAAAPGVEAAAAPEAPAAPEAGAAAIPVPETVTEAAPPAGGPAKPEAPVAEAAPAPAEPPGLPPLTPEEEEMLARIAAEGPGSALPPGETAPEPAAEAAPEAAPEPPPVLTEREDDRVLRPEEEGSTLPPAPALADEGEGVTTGRLPRIGDAAEEAPAEAAATDTRPIAAHARPFDNPEGKPAFAIVLIDEGAADTDRAALAALPFPVTFALDPTDPLVAEHAAIYRGAGQEVAMLATALPKGAQAADIEVALSVMAAALPEAVAVMDLPARAFQADRPLATLVVPAVGAGGRGLLTWDQGLNAADQVARREDIPAAVAFRDLDGAGESAPVIRRYLDRAAFKAAQEGRVTVVGRTRPETVAALLEWAVEGRAATVALAPLTAVLSVD